MSAVLLEQDRLLVLHRIHVVHGGTGRAWPHFNARILGPAWPHWRLRKRGATCVLSALERFRADEPVQTTLEVAVSQPELVERFAANGVATVSLQSAADTEVTLVLDSVPVQLEVTLLSSAGAPRTGRALEARSNGHTVPLPALATTSNIYRSAPTAWDPAAQPYRIFVDGTQRAFASLDYRRPVTRMQVIEP